MSQVDVSTQEQEKNKAILREIDEYLKKRFRLARDAVMDQLSETFGFKVKQWIYKQAGKAGQKIAVEFVKTVAGGPATIPIKIGLKAISFFMPAMYAIENYVNTGYNPFNPTSKPVDYTNFIIYTWHNNGKPSYLFLHDWPRRYAGGRWSGLFAGALRRRTIVGTLHLRGDFVVLLGLNNLNAVENFMGFFDGVIGNASKIDPTEIQQEFSQILAPNEQVEHAYQLIRDYFVFTNKRFVFVDKQGITGTKIEYHSIPYKSITHFSVETAGHFDLDAELKIWISGAKDPIQHTFNRSLSIYEVQSVLASYVLR